MDSYCCICKDRIDACEYGHTKCLKLYLSQDSTDLNKWVYREFYCADTESSYERYGILLHIACKKGYGDCVKILLKYMDPNISDQGNTALQVLCYKPENREKIIKLLLEDPRTDTNTLCDSWYGRFPLYAFVDNIDTYKVTHQKDLNGITTEIIILFLQRNASTQKDDRSDNDTFDMFSRFRDIKFAGKTFIELFLEYNKVTDETINYNKNRMNAEELRIIEDWMKIAIKEPSDD
jgi:hypothetical protein